MGRISRSPGRGRNRIFFYGETQEDKIFSYKVTNIEKTELDAVADYKTENPEYKTSYNPKGILSDLDTNYLIDSGYRLQFDVFTSSAGLAGETPDYSVTGVYEEYGDYKYWYSSRGNGVNPMSDGLYSVEVKDGRLLSEMRLKIIPLRIIISILI